MSDNRKKFAVSQSVVMLAHNRFACTDRDDDSLINIDGVSLDVEAATKLCNWLISILPPKDDEKAKPRS